MAKTAAEIKVPALIAGRDWIFAGTALENDPAALMSQKARPTPPEAARPALQQRPYVWRKALGGREQPDALPGHFGAVIG